MRFSYIRQRNKIYKSAHGHNIHEQKWLTITERRTTMRSIKEVLMTRDGLSEEEAIEQVEDAKKLLDSYLKDGNFSSADEICQTEFGLEPDYLMDLIDYL